MGFFLISNVPAGEYKIRAEKNGYFTKEVGVKVFSSTITTADILLQKISGSAPDTTGNPNENDTIILKEGLIAYYKFDNNVKDYSDNHLDGVISYIKFVEDRKGNQNSAIEFYGSNVSYVNIPFNNLLNPSSFSYSFWVNPNQGYGLPDAAGYIDIISRWGHWGPGYTTYAISIRQDGTLCVLLYKVVNPNNFGAPENYNYAYSNEPIKTNQWTHVVVTHNSQKGATRIYINGVLDREQATFTPQISSVYGLRIGSRIDVTNSHFSGKLDDLRIYARELTPEEVKLLFEE